MMRHPYAIGSSFRLSRSILATSVDRGCGSSSTRAIIGRILLITETMVGRVTQRVVVVLAVFGVRRKYVAVVELLRTMLVAVCQLWRLIDLHLRT